VNYLTMTQSRQFVSPLLAHARVTYAFLRQIGIFFAILHCSQINNVVVAVVAVVVVAVVGVMTDFECYEKRLVA